MWKTIKSGEIWEGIFRNRNKNGSYYWVKTTIVPLCNEQNEPFMFVSLRTDITSAKETEEKLVSALKNDFNLVVDSMNNLIFKVCKNANGEMYYQFGDGKLSHLLGFKTDELFHKSPYDIFDPELARIMVDHYNRAFNGESVTYDYSYKGYRLLTTLTPIYEEGKIVSIIGCSNDITELNKAREKIQFLAYHDELTGLRNRKKFSEDLTKLVTDKTAFALFLFDLDRFKFINDSLGHHMGDALLKEVAKKISNLFDKRDYCRTYRFANDEFAMIIKGDFNNYDELFAIGDRLVSSFSEKISIVQSIDLYVTTSVGISIFKGEEVDVDQIIGQAEFAINEAKRLGRNTYVVYNQELDSKTKKRIQLERALEMAIVNQEFELHFQPKLSLKTGEINSMEALIRWYHPEMGYIPPNVFIKIAEENGFIWRINEWVLRRACEQNKEWNNMNPRLPLRIAVNISAIHFCHPDFVEMVRLILNETGLKPDLLEIEITESTIISNPEQCIRNVNELRKMGVLISIDDFGTGFTSLNYIKSFPFDYLKIDSSYIQGILRNKEDWIIVKTITSLAHELNLKVVAEGVEEEEVIEKLKIINCEEIQGYVLSRPISKEDFEDRFVRPLIQK